MRTWKEISAPAWEKGIGQERRAVMLKEFSAIYKREKEGRESGDDDHRENPGGPNWLLWGAIGVAGIVLIPKLLSSMNPCVPGRSKRRADERDEQRTVYVVN